MTSHRASDVEGSGDEETTLIAPTQGHVEYVPAHSRVVSDTWIRNRIISVVACTCIGSNIVTWLTTREVNAILIGAGVSLLVGVPILNRDDKRGG